MLKGSKWVRLVKGKAMGHHESEETYLATGPFMFEFSQLEMVLRNFTALRSVYTGGAAESGWGGRRWNLN